MPRVRAALAAAIASAALAPFATAQLDTTGIQIPGEEEGMTYQLVNDLLRFGEPEPRPRTPGTLRLATYNIENLFDDIDDPALTGRNDDKDMLKPLSHRHAAARAIRAIDADVLTLQEIESEEALRAFRDEFLQGMGYEHIASIDAGDSRGIEQAVLSRYPITHIQNWPGLRLEGIHPAMYGRSENWYAGEPIDFRRSPLLVEVQVPGGEGAASYALSLLVMHHKSGGPAGYWREAEADGVLKLINELMAANPARNLAVLGDFNAQTSDESVQRYLRAGFVDAFGELPESRTGVPRTLATHSSGRRIDLILVNDNLNEELVAGSAWVMATVARELDADRRDPPPPGWASDHYPVVVDLTPREASAAKTEASR